MRFLLMLCLSACLSSSAQTIMFKGQLLNKNAAVKNYTIIVNGKPATTDDSGIFLTALASSVMQVTVNLSDKRYIVAYPTGGRVLIPKDPSLPTEIVLEAFQSNNKLKNYLDISRQLKDSTGRSRAEVKALHEKVDSAIKMLYKLSYTADDLRSARERQDGMDLFYPEISSALQNYYNQAKDLENAFKFNSESAFSNHNALDQLAQAVNGYNPAFEKIYNNHLTYAKKIDDYWQDESLKASFEEIADTIINKIHLKTIYPLNDLKQAINNYFMRQMKDSPTKQKIQNQIAVVVPKLDLQLNDLQIQIQKFQNQLKNY